MNKKVKLAGCSAIFFSAISMLALGLNQPCKSQMLGGNYNNLILIETEEVKNEFEYKDSVIGPVVKAKVTYSRPNEEAATPVHYETLWLHGWQTLGCRRMNELRLGNGQSAIQVKHKSGYGSLPEGEAAAKAILRIFVDMYAQKHAVTTIIVPDESIGYILNQMPRAGFNPGPKSKPDVPVYSLIVIPVSTASGSEHQVLYYSPGSGGG